MAVFFHEASRVASRKQRQDNHCKIDAFASKIFGYQKVDKVLSQNLHRQRLRGAAQQMKF